MGVLLIDVHGAAEHEHGVVGVGGFGGLRSIGDPPFRQLVAAVCGGIREDAAGRVVLVNDREDAHASSVARGTSAEPGTGHRIPGALGSTNLGGSREPRTDEQKGYEDPHQQGEGASEAGIDHVHI
jgi:hypothetical protein